MRIVADVDFYPPNTLGGSEMALHGVLKWLAARGHEVRVCCTRKPRKGTFEGVYQMYPGLARRHEWWEWADLGITQHASTGTAVKFAAEHDTPLAFYSHRGEQVDEHPELGPDVLVLFNSAAESRPRPNSLVCRPPVFSADYRTEPGEMVTAVNLSNLKGGPVLWHLAAVDPWRKFLAVKGAWQEPGDEQVVPRTVPSNVTVQHTTANMRDVVYARTRVLLMASRRETWGRVGVEAAASGIPVIANPTPGLRECLGDAAVWCDRDDLDQWHRTLMMLDRESFYAERSEAMLARSAELDRMCEADLLAVEEAFMAQAGAK